MLTETPLGTPSMNAAHSRPMAAALVVLSAWRTKELLKLKLPALCPGPNAARQFSRRSMPTRRLCVRMNFVASPRTVPTL